LSALAVLYVAGTAVVAGVVGLARLLGTSQPEAFAMELIATGVIGSVGLATTQLAGAWRGRALRRRVIRQEWTDHRGRGSPQGSIDVWHWAEKPSPGRRWVRPIGTALEGLAVVLVAVAAPALVLSALGVIPLREAAATALATASVAWVLGEASSVLASRTTREVTPRNGGIAGKEDHPETTGGEEPKEK